MNGEASIDDSEDSINPIAMFCRCIPNAFPLSPRENSRDLWISVRFRFQEKGHSIQELLLALENHRGEPSGFFYIKLPHPRASRASRASWDFTDNHGYHLFCANGSISIHIDPISESLLFGTLFLVIIKVLTVSRLEGPGPRASRNQRSLRLEGYFVWMWIDVNSKGQRWIFPFFPPSKWHVDMMWKESSGKQWETQQETGNVGGFKHFLFSIIYGMSSFPLTNSYFSRWAHCTTNQQGPKRCSW